MYLQVFIIANLPAITRKLSPIHRAKKRLFSHSVEFKKSLNERVAVNQNDQLTKTMNSRGSLLPL